MCVIAIAEDGRPTERQVREMFAANPNGGGAVWREAEDEKIAVNWRKGLDEEEMVAIAATLPLPFVLHFRIPSCGGETLKLNHPFPLQRDVPLDYNGVTTGNVLMHNGHWGKWENELKAAVFMGHLKMPVGPWSDTRAMAFLAAHFGTGYLEAFVDEKIVIYGPERIQILGLHDTHRGWSYINNGEVLVSNRFWEGRSLRGSNTGNSSNYYQRIPASIVDDDYESLQSALQDTTTPAICLPGPVQTSTDHKQVSGGTPLDERPFRTDTGDVRPEADQQVEVQEVQETSRSASGQALEGSARTGTKRKARTGTEPDPGSGGTSGGDGSGYLYPEDDPSLSPHQRAICRAQRLKDQAMSRWARSLNPKVSPSVRDCSTAHGISGGVQGPAFPSKSHTASCLYPCKSCTCDAFSSENEREDFYREHRARMKEMGIEIQGPI